LAFLESIFEVSDFEVSVSGKIAFRDLGIPEKGFRKIKFGKLTNTFLIDYHISNCIQFSKLWDAFKK